MIEQSLDGLIVVDPLDVSYLTGFGGEDSVLVVTAKRKVLVTDSRFSVQARQECPGLPVHIRKGQINEAVALMLQRFFKSKRKPPAVGIEADNITVSQFRAYRKIVGKGLKSVKPLVTPLRQRKDDYEITQIRKAIRVAQDAMTQTIRLMKVGMSEIEIAARLEYEMTCRGSIGTAFPTIVAAGARAAQPHAIPGKNRLRKNQSILFDWGARINGYRSDLTRCLLPVEFGLFLPTPTNGFWKHKPLQLQRLERAIRWPGLIGPPEKCSSAARFQFMATEPATVWDYSSTSTPDSTHRLRACCRMEW